jgi:type IV secretion system protein VirD4
MLPSLQPDTASADTSAAGSFLKGDPDNAGIRREPTLPAHEAMVREEPQPRREFALLDEDLDDAPVRAPSLTNGFAGVAPQAALDPDDGLDL